LKKRTKEAQLFGKRFALPVAILFAAHASVAGAQQPAKARSHELADAVQSQNAAAVARLLTSRPAVDVNMPQGDGSTALHWAAQWNNADTVDRLLKAAPT
jgi:ankyrin repeat protein